MDSKARKPQAMFRCATIDPDGIRVRRYTMNMSQAVRKEEATERLKYQTHRACYFLT